MKLNLKIFIKSLLIILIIILIGVIIYNSQNKKVENLNCYKEIERNVSGSSMFPMFSDGEMVISQENYYTCNEVQKGDVVVLTFKTQKDNFIKKIMGMPGDEIIFENGKIILNGVILKNSKGDYYKIDNIQKKILTIPLDQNKIPRNGYLVLGDDVNLNIFDSRKFGYVSDDQILGRVIKK